MPEPSALDAIRERLKKCTRDNRHHHGMLVYGHVYVEDVAYLLSLIDAPPASNADDKVLAEALLDATTTLNEGTPS